MDKKVKVSNLETEKEQFLTLAKEVYPLVEKIREALEKSGFKASASISIGENGYMEFRPYDTGWRMNKYSSGDKPVAQFEYQEKISIEEE